MPKTLQLVLIAVFVFVFVGVAALLAYVMPAPLRSVDYLVIGSVSTLMALLAAFLLMVTVGGKQSNAVFFKKRKK